MSARKDVFLKPGMVEIGNIAFADKMQQHHPVPGQQVAAFPEERVEKPDADMLEHPDRDNAFERALGRTVILQAERQFRLQ